MNPGFHGVRRIHLPFSLPFPFIVALAAGAGLRLAAMLGYPGALWFAGDSYVYLGAALRPQPNLSKTTGYSVFLHILEPFHSLTLVAGLQHLTGLAVAVMIYLLLRRNGLRVLQIDPVNVVARSHLLVLWSRLGGFDRDDLDTLLWRERWLFEYWAHAASIVLTEDYPIHRVMMRAYGTIENQRMREWLSANDDFRRYVLDRLRDAGPLPGDAIEDRSAMSWTSTGWTNGRNVERMLDTLWKQGVITVACRDGLRRLWGLADFPAAADLPREESVTQAAGHALRALGVARRETSSGTSPSAGIQGLTWSAWPGPARSGSRAAASSGGRTGTRSACSTRSGGRGPRCCPRSTT